MSSCHPVILSSCRHAVMLSWQAAPDGAEDAEIEGLMRTLEDEVQRKRAAQDELAACRETLKQAAPDGAHWTSAPSDHWTEVADAFRTAERTRSVAAAFAGGIATAPPASPPASPPAATAQRTGSLPGWRGPLPDEVKIGLGRVVVLETEALNLLAKLV
jgi:hypothetical protein